MLTDREAVAVAELGIVQMPDHGGGGAAAGRQVSGVQDGFEDVTERVVHPDVVRAGVTGWPACPA